LTCRSFIFPLTIETWKTMFSDSGVL
jgi:hypothetical protein